MKLALIGAACGLAVCLSTPAGAGDPVWGEWTKSTTPAWEGFFMAGDPCVVTDGDIYRMYFTGWLPDPERATIGVAESSDGLNWDWPAGMAPFNEDTLLRVTMDGRPGEWDESLETVHVMRVGVEWWMFYTGYVEDPGRFVFPHEIGLAKSADGINWTRASNDPVLPLAASGPDNGAMTSPAVVEFDGTFYMIYLGWELNPDGSFNGFRINGATSTDPDGLVWTRHTEPVLQVPIDGMDWVNAAVEPSLMKASDGMFYLFITADRDDNPDSPSNIAVLRSDHPFGPWTPCPDPILEMTEWWESEEIIAPHAMQDGDRMRLWYHALTLDDPETGERFRVGYAETPWPLVTSGVEPIKIVADPDGGVYLGSHHIFKGFGLEYLEEVFERPLSIRPSEDCLRTFEFSDEGVGMQIIPELDVDCLLDLKERGIIPVIGVDAWLCSDEPAVWTVQDVIDGELDGVFRGIAQQLAEIGWPVFWIYQREPVIQWPGYGPEGMDCRYGCFDIAGFQACDFTGAQDPPENFTTYGDPALLDGPERYIDFHRHMHDVMEDQIASMGLASPITWVAGAGTEGPFDLTYGDYWVGDAWTDWHALDYYAGLEDNDCAPFPGFLAWDDVVALAPDKPVMLFEFGVLASLGGDTPCGDRTDWLEGFFTDIRGGAFPQLSAIIHFDWVDDPFNVRYQPDEPAAETWRVELEAFPQTWPLCVSLSDGSEVCPPCPVDLTGDGVVDLADVQAFITGFMTQDPIADLDSSGVWDLTDVMWFIAFFESPVCSPQ